MGDRIEPAREPGVRGAGPRILQVLPSLGDGGAERDTLDLAHHLTLHGWTPIVASSGGRGEIEACKLGIATFKLPLNAKNPLVIRANIGRLQRLAQEQGVRLIHAHSRAAAWSSWYAARRCGIPFVTTVHGVYRGSRSFLKRRYNGIMAQGDRVIAVSEHVASHVRERYGVADDRLRVIYRGIDLKAFAAEAIGRKRPHDLAMRWQVPRSNPEVKVVMLAGRITRIKGHLLLLQAIEQMTRRDFVCLLVGPSKRGSRYIREVERQIGSRGLSRSVRLVGACGDMPAALSLADVVVMPSIGPEAFGRVSIEAQALGRPVIATDVGGLGETLMPAATGWLVPPDNAAELARALELALAMPDDARARLAVRARHLVQRRFSIERMAESTIAVYRELLGAAAPTSADAPARVPGVAPEADFTCRTTGRVPS
jgi:glycosyltransferase involved in cell wall biosynthesis